jgi:hypothetical protein
MEWDVVPPGRGSNTHENHGRNLHKIFKNAKENDGDTRKAFILRETQKKTIGNSIFRKGCPHGQNIQTGSDFLFHFIRLRFRA